MAVKDFTVAEDVWIGNIEQRPINPESAEGGAFRLKKGEKITTERAAALGLAKAPKAAASDDDEPAAEEPEEKAKPAAPANKARTKRATK